MNPLDLGLMKSKEKQNWIKVNQKELPYTLDTNWRLKKIYLVQVLIKPYSNYVLNKENFWLHNLKKLKIILLEQIRDFNQINKWKLDLECMRRQLFSLIKNLDRKILYWVKIGDSKTNQMKFLDLVNTT